MKTRKTVWLYEDCGVAAQGILDWEQLLSQQEDMRVVRVSAEQVQAGIVADYFIIGGGADLPYCARLHGAGTAAIKRFVAAGGGYIGVCAGAYFACQQVDFIGAGYRIYGSRELGFFQGIARGSLPALVGGRYYDLTDDSRAWIRLPEFAELAVLYHGGCAFVGDTREVRVLAHYPQSALPAIITGRYGQGFFLLSGVHFEAGDTAGIFFAKLRAIIEAPYRQGDGNSHLSK